MNWDSSNGDSSNGDVNTCDTDGCNNQVYALSGWPNDVSNPQHDWSNVWAQCEQCMFERTLGRTWTWIGHECCEPLIQRRKELLAERVANELTKV